MKSTANEVERLKTEYLLRDKRLAGADIYAWRNPSYIFTIHQRQRAIVRLLIKHKIISLEGKSILEIGCGKGGVLVDFHRFISREDQLFGIDILSDRIRDAKELLPGANIIQANGQTLPYVSKSFDLVLQFTALSSILDGGIRNEICREMVRVLRPPGMIIWYDFWLNPTNRHTHGIKPPEIRRMFPGCSFHFQKVTLAPPIARRIVPISAILAALLEKVRIFNSHYLVAIHPLSQDG
jgi:ubiquinone/menaquinone biosynthesis C-methylase UbiE